MLRGAAKRRLSTLIEHILYFEFYIFVFYRFIGIIGVRQRRRRFEMGVFRTFMLVTSNSACWRCYSEPCNLLWHSPRRYLKITYLMTIILYFSDLFVRYFAIFRSLTLHSPWLISKFECLWFINIIFISNTCVCCIQFHLIPSLERFGNLSSFPFQNKEVRLLGTSYLLLFASNRQIYCVKQLSRSAHSYYLFKWNVERTGSSWRT